MCIRDRFRIGGNTAAGTAQSVCGTEHYRIADFFGNLQTMLYILHNIRGRHRLTDFLHGLLEHLAVLGLLDGQGRGADQAHIVFFKETCILQLHEMCIRDRYYPIINLIYMTILKTSEVWIMAKKRIVMAIGHKDMGTNLPEQKAAVAGTAKIIADFIQEGWQVAIVHSNAPQVGMIHTAMNEFGKQHDGYSQAPMSVCSAMSQGYIGYDLQNGIRAELIRRGIYKPDVYKRQFQRPVRRWSLNMQPEGYFFQNWTDQWNNRQAETLTQ